MDYLYHLLIDNNIIYVGKTSNHKQRLRQHNYLLKRGIHKNKALQSAYDVHKTVDMVIVGTYDNIDVIEQQQILQHKTKQRNNHTAVYSVDDLRQIHNDKHNT